MSIVARRLQRGIKKAEDIQLSTLAVSSSWAGAATTTTLSVVTVANDQAARALEWSTLATFDGMQRTTYVTPNAQGTVRHDISGISPGQKIYYRARTATAVSTTLSSIKTLPSHNSFKFGFGSCRDHTLDAPVLEHAMSQNIDMFLVTGDMHYMNIATNDQGSFRSGYDSWTNKPLCGQLAKSVPMDYVYDDHDFGPNDSMASSPSRPAAQQVYRERFPHYTLPSPSGGIYHTYAIGRCRFIVMDCRSYKTSGTMLGSEQLSWLSSTIQNAAEPVLFVVSSVAWIDSSTTSGYWGTYTSERQQIATMLSGKNAIFLCGDMHALAYDDGRNSAGGFPVFHAAAINRGGSVKGGPYSGGTSAGAHRYGLVTVTDSGAQIAVNYTGIYDTDQVWGSWNHTFNLPA